MLRHPGSAGILVEDITSIVRAAAEHVVSAPKSPSGFGGTAKMATNRAKNGIEHSVPLESNPKTEPPGTREQDQINHVADVLFSGETALMLGLKCSASPMTASQ